MKTFNNFSEAFDYCREAGKPVVIEIAGDGKFKLFPSGKATRLTTITATKTLACTTGPKAAPTSTLVQLNGIPADTPLRPALAAQAARVAFGHRNGVTVTDPLTGASYRLYVNTARKLCGETVS